MLGLEPNNNCPTTIQRAVAFAWLLTFPSSSPSSAYSNLLTVPIYRSNTRIGERWPAISCTSTNYQSIHPLLFFFFCDFLPCTLCQKSFQIFHDVEGKLYKLRTRRPFVLFLRRWDWFLLRISPSLFSRQKVRSTWWIRHFYQFRMLGAVQAVRIR